jgi:hypothetical protein
LEQVASRFANGPAEVRCPSMEEWIADPIWGTDPNPQRAWGYTNMLREYIALHPALCAGALAGLRRWRWRRDEAKVECQAIRHFTVGAQLLGASRQLANDLLAYALAAHARVVTLFPEYYDRTCRLPLWATPISP